MHDDLFRIHILLSTKDLFKETNNDSALIESKIANVVFGFAGIIWPNIF